MKCGRVLEREIDHFNIVAIMTPGQWDRSLNLNVEVLRDQSNYNLLNTTKYRQNNYKEITVFWAFQHTSKYKHGKPID